MRYAYGQYPCYSFSSVQIAAYKNYAQDKILELCIVDEECGKICCGRLDDSNDTGLERKVFIDGKEFPLEKETRKGLFRFYHVKQFLSEHEIAGYDLARLRAIKISDAEPDIPEVNRFGEAQSMVFDYLEIMLPDDLPIEEEKIPAFVKNLATKLEEMPTAFFYEIRDALDELLYEQKIETVYDNKTKALAIFNEELMCVLKLKLRWEMSQKFCTNTPSIAFPIWKIT